MPDPNRWKALAIVCAAFFMTVLDVSIVNVALPSIGESLHFSEANLQWVITAYAITFGGFLLLGGRAADLLGRRRVFYVGVMVFTIASFLCGLAWSEGVLIGARAVQGLGAAIISPAALSIIMTTFDEGAERNKALGIWGAIGGSGAAVGVLAGGVLTKYLGWEWIFFVNVPVGVLALVLAPRFVRESRSEREQTQDFGGAITITAGLALLVYGVSQAPQDGWASGCDDRAARRRGGAPDRVPRDRVSRQGPADAVQHLQGAHGRRRERRRSSPRRGRVRELLPAHAVRPAGARLVGAEDRRDVHRDGRARRFSGRASRRRS